MAAEPQTAFFSYSRDDSEFALRLAGDLKAAGAKVWLDQLDITPGQRWARAVQDALNNCQRFLVILSPASVSSTNVEDEVAFALEEHKTVIPVFYRDCKVPFQLRPFQYVDFRTDYDRGLKTLLRTLGVEQQAVAAARVAAVPAAAKESEIDVSDVEGYMRSAEEARREDERKRASAQARLEQQERERLATEERERQQKLEAERQAAADQARLQEERRLSAEKAQREEQDRKRKAAEEKARPFLSKKMMIGLAGGVVVLLLVGILWWRRSHNQTSQPQTAGPPPQSTQQQPQTTEPQTQTAVQQPQDTGPKPQPPAADVKKPVAKDCPEGVYCDPDTNLMWTIKDNGKDITWPDAEQYCKNRSLAGLSGWELPTFDELEKLYDPHNSSAYKIRKPLRLTRNWVWSSPYHGSGSAWNFYSGSGGQGLYPMDSSADFRALCVRRSTWQKPQPAAADVNKPVAKNCPEGLYCDPKTNLMWTIKDNGEDIDWPDAERYCKNLTLAGLSGWELPTIDELARLYDPQDPSRYKIRKPLYLPTCCPWSSTKASSGSAWAFYFDVGERHAGPMGDSVTRALCVRRPGK